jgi:hypothetical protein
MGFFIKELGIRWDLLIEESELVDIVLDYLGPETGVEHRG